MKIAFDFDGTLTEDRILNFADELVKEGHELWICTFRYTQIDRGIHITNDDVWETAELLKIPKNRVLFTEHQFIKGELLSKNNIDVFIDDWDEMVEDAMSHGVHAFQVGNGDVENMKSYINQQTKEQ